MKLIEGVMYMSKWFKLDRSSVFVSIKSFLQFPPKSQCDTHFCTDLRERGFSYSGRGKYSEVARVTEKNEKREHEKREGALGMARE